MISLSGPDRWQEVPESCAEKGKNAKLIVDLLQGLPERFKAYNSPDIRSRLEKHHFRKCIYCESIVIHASYMNIDHYRPKAFKEKQNGSHAGYHWLALEWSNLLLSCGPCNTKKSNRFPLGEGSERVSKPGLDLSFSDRQADSSILQSEKRLLLNPELDQVEDHLKFHGNGRVKGLTEAGKRTVHILDLNRKQLVQQRALKVGSYYWRLIRLLRDFEKDGAGIVARRNLWRQLRHYFADLLREQQPHREFSRLGYCMFHRFETYYIASLPEGLEEHGKMVRGFYRALLGKV